jgi:iron complex outermembrane receptor protein
MSMDFFDLERIEIMRGPQGVLLGKNVVGGALSIITAKPQFETSGDALFSVGNLDSLMFSGHVTGAISEQWAARAAVQFRKNNGFATDVLKDRDLHDTNASQARVALLYQGDNDLMAHFTLEYLDESGNGTCGIGTGGNPWDITRQFVGLDSIRECMPEEVQYSNSPTPRNQGYDRKALSFMMKIEKEFDSSTLTSVTGYRDGDGESQYSQTGLGPDAPGVTEAFFAALGGTGNPAHIGTLGSCI